MATVEVRQIQKSDVDVIKGLFGLGETGIDAFSSLFNKLVDLAKTNPLWGAVLGLMVTDLLSHKVNLFAWTHTETYCVNCSGGIINPGQLIAGSVFPPLLFITGFQLLTGTGHTDSSLSQTHRYSTVEMPGILSQATTQQVAVMILSGFGVATAGQIIADVSKITQVVGGASQDSVIKPSITTLVEGSSQRAVTVDVSKDKVSS